MVPKRGLVEVRITRVFANTSVIIHLISAVGGKSLRFFGHSEGGTFPAFAWGCFFLGRGKSWRAWRALPCERGARYRLIFSWRAWRALPSDFFLPLLVAWVWGLEGGFHWVLWWEVPRGACGGGLCLVNRRLLLLVLRVVRWLSSSAHGGFLLGNRTTWSVARATV